ncbi:MAG TPA: HAD-IA family hydrolase [Nevskiaceae bacterium]|nr:HAD-IA family hydrolase [Nevskiaceae bacterium]
MTRSARLATPACVLFDLDGTLLDTAPDLGHAANLVRGEAGLPPLPIADYRPVASTGARGLLKVGLDLAPDHPDYPARRDSLLAHYRAGLARSTRPFPGIAELLLNLELRGIRWGVVTNKPGWLTQPLMQELDLASRAACVVSGDTCAKAKPAPDPLLHACAQIDLEPKACIYVGDDQRDVEAARAAKMRSVAAGWGYLGSDVPIDAWGADFVTPTVTDLANLLS